MTKQARKLQTALIETGNEVEDIKEIPSFPEMDAELYRLKLSCQSGNMKVMRQAGRRLAALVRLSL